MPSTSYNFIAQRKDKNGPSLKVTFSTSTAFRALSTGCACGGDFWDYYIDLVIPLDKDFRSICRDCGGEYRWFIKKDDRNTEAFWVSLQTTSNRMAITYCTEMEVLPPCVPGHDFSLNLSCFCSGTSATWYANVSIDCPLESRSLWKCPEAFCQTYYCLILSRWESSDDQAKNHLAESRRKRGRNRQDPDDGHGHETRRIFRRG